ncbi:MAG: flippase, partial [Candidatus Thermoplasmatota archaeon]|nr:flippase [Candidatus Thermoplasmatota archaeon]
YYIGSLIPLVRWYHLMVFAGLGLAIYLGVLYALKEFKKQDLMFFLDMLHPKEMLTYIKSELKDKDFSNKK